MSEDCCFINPSYFFFTDSEGRGRKGNYYYFTYFTQYDNSTSVTEYFEAGFFIINCILSCLLNSLIFLSMTNHELRIPCNIFIFNMAVADLLYGLIGPLMAAVRLHGDWNLGDVMCHLVFYIQSICGCVVCWSIAAVSIDRYIHIVHPMRVQLAITVHRAGIIITVIWFISIIFMSPLGLYFQIIERPIPHSHNQTAHVCTLFWPQDLWSTLSITGITTVSCTVFLLPVGSMIWCYSRCAKEMRTVRKSVNQRMDSIGSCSCVLDTKRRRCLREYRVIRTFMILLIVYILAWGPVFIVIPLIVVDVYNKTAFMPSDAFIWSIALAQFNAVVNPVVYGLFMKNIRSNIIKRFQNVL